MKFAYDSYSRILQITHTIGNAVQHLQYLPWGEDFVEQRPTSYNARYTFSAKEKDTETGYSYVGARYYNSELSLWLSVDPMADKYPSMSPYTYCANNPVKLVDPNGEEIGDFYDLYGTYLGNDGKDDGKVYLVQGSSANYVSENRKNQKKTSADDPNITILHSTTYEDIGKAIEVFDAAVKNGGGKNEEGGAFDSDGNWRQGEGSSSSVELPITIGKTSIHSHTWGKNDERDGGYRSPENPSTVDKNTFQGFSQNIIVGKKVGDYNSFPGHTSRKDAMSFYDKTATHKCTISMDAAHKIVERGQRTGHLK